MVAVAEEAEQGLPLDHALRGGFDFADVDLGRFLHRGELNTRAVALAARAGGRYARAMSFVQMLWVFVAGGLGSVARWLVSLACLGVFGPIYPVGTLAVNTIGCFLLAALIELAVSGDRISPVVRVALASGFLGGFTTYSTFSHEAFTYLRDGALGLGFGYVAVTVLLCLAACLLGQLTARSFVGT